MAKYLARSCQLPEKLKWLKILQEVANRKSCLCQYVPALFSPEKSTPYALHLSILRTATEETMRNPLETEQSKLQKQVEDLIHICKCCLYLLASLPYHKGLVEPTCIYYRYNINKIKSTCVV